MVETLNGVVRAAVLVFAVSSMLSVGLAHDWRAIVGPLRDWRKVVRALATNFVLVPLLAVFVIQIISLERPHAIGLFLVASAAGAPFLIKLAESGETDVALGTTLLVVLLPATIVYMPLVVPLALPDAAVSTAAIARPLVLTMLLPLAVGLVAHAYAQPLAARLQPLAARVSTAALLVIIAAQVLANLPAIVAIFATPAIVAALLLVAGAFVIGYALGGPSRASKEVLGLGTAQRNIGAATVVATQAIRDVDAVAMVIVTSLVGFAILFPAAALMRSRWGGSPAESD